MSTNNQPTPPVGLKIPCSPQFRSYLNSNVPSVRIVHDEVANKWQTTDEQRGLIVFLMPPSYPDMQGIEITRVRGNVAFAREF